MDARDIHHNMTILLGVIGDQGQDIKSIKADLHVVKDDLSTVKADVGSMKVDLGAVKEDLGVVKGDIAALETHVEARMTTLETRMLDGFKQILTVIDSRLPPAIVVIRKLIASRSFSGIVEIRDRCYNEENFFLALTI